MDREGDAPLIRVMRFALNMIVIAAGWISRRVAMQAVLRANDESYMPVKASFPRRHALPALADTGEFECVTCQRMLNLAAWVKSSNR